MSLWETGAWTQHMVWEDGGPWRHWAQGGLDEVRTPGLGLAQQ